MSLALAIQAPGVLTQVGWVLPEGLPLEEWVEATEGMKAIREGVAWAIGDALVYGRAHYGEEYSQALGDMMDRSPETLRQDEYVAEHVKIYNRLYKLSWSHHRLVVNLDDDAQNYWLMRALEENWTVKEFAAQMKGDDEKEEPQLKGRAKEAWEYVQTRHGREWLSDDSDHVYAILSGAVDAEGPSGNRVDVDPAGSGDLDVEGSPEVQGEMPLDGGGDGSAVGSIRGEAGPGEAGVVAE